MARARTALLICAVTFAVATPAAAQNPSFTYVVLGANGPVARAVVPAGTSTIVPHCPAIVVNDESKQMVVRAKPDDDYPILVCEYPLASATSAWINQGEPLPLPPAALKSIVALGDTGCRLKADKATPEQAARDRDEDEDEGDFQNCDETADWPFAPMSKTIAEAKPDLVLHVGDYHYRESPCPSGDDGCKGSPYGYNWAAWEADFFTPAAPLLRAAPWIVTRGNHESCKRAGVGYMRLLDPTLATNETPPACSKLLEVYKVSAGGRAFIVLDSSDAPDECGKDCPKDSAPFKEQFKRIEHMHPEAGTWLLTHRPIWGFTNSKNVLGTRNETLQKALDDWDGVPPAGIDLVLSGHIHLWEALSFEKKGVPQSPLQFVLGNGGTQLAREITENLEGETVGGRKVLAAATDHRFGYTMFTPSNGHWQATYHTITTCTVAPPELKCE